MEHVKKREEISKEFSETEAYSDLYIELATDADAAAEFVNGIVPKAPITNATGQQTLKPVTE